MDVPQENVAFLSEENTMLLAYIFSWIKIQAENRQWEPKRMAEQNSTMVLLDPSPRQDFQVSTEEFMST